MAGKVEREAARESRAGDTSVSPINIRPGRALDQVNGATVEERESHGLDDPEQLPPALLT